MLPLPTSTTGGTFRWIAPRPIDDLEVVVTNPAGADWSAPLTPVRPASTVDSLDAGRTTLHLTAPVLPAVDPVAAGYGDILLAAGDALVEAIVSNIEGDLVELGAPLRTPIVTPAAMHWAHHVAELPAGVTAIARDLGWAVTTPDGDERRTIATGTLSIRKRVFGTGLTVSRLHQEARWIARAAEARLSDQPAVDAALVILRNRIGRTIDRPVDTIPNGQDFLHVHVRLAEAQLTKSSDDRQSLRTEAWSLLDDLLDPYMVDKDGDGVIEGKSRRTMSVGGGSSSSFRPFSDDWGI